MEPRVEYVARSLFRGDQRPQKPVSWDNAGEVDRSYYYALAAVALGALADFDAQRDHRSRCRGWLYEVRTMPLIEHGGERNIQALVTVQTFWSAVKEWFLGGVVDLSMPITRAAVRSGGYDRFDGNPEREDVRVDHYLRDEDIGLGTPDTPIARADS